MKNKAALTAVTSILCASLLAGCSYFPAIKLPEGETTMTLVSTTSKPSESETVTQTETAATEAKDPVEEADKAFADFLEGKVSLSTSGCFDKDNGRKYLELGFGDYTFDELKKALRFDEVSGSRARYALVHCGDDGIREMALCFARIDGGARSVLCLIGCENGKLVMNGFLEQQRADEYRLYDSGYLKADVVTSEGVNRSVLIRIENGGKCSEVFTYNEYRGPVAKAIIKHLSKSEEETGEGFEGLPKEFLIREYISDGKVMINVGDYSTYESEKKLEQEFVDKLKSLGAEEVPFEHMMNIASAKEYLTKETTWTTIKSEDETTASAGVAEVAGKFSISVYPDPSKSEYTGLGNIVTVLCSGNGTDMRFVCDSDDVTVILDKGFWNMNTDSFVKESELFNIQTKVGTVYQFNCVPQDIFPYYRLRAAKGNYSAEWLVLKSKDNGVTVIKSSMKGTA